jgi:NAD(P)-dependent dehydrogenase (short-subunit alcohol dehydrogenase family)
MTTADKIAVITGTTHGIGRVTARELARAGVGLVML